MVCLRCVLSVEKILKDLAIDFTTVRVGEIVLKNPLLNTALMVDLKQRLNIIGLALLKNHQQILIEKIKYTVVKMVYEPRNYDSAKINLSVLLSQRMSKNYAALSSAFSESEGTTIEQFFIGQKIERAKELLAYNEMTLSEIAYLLGYSSVGHLSNQFKKVTGSSPTIFKSLGMAGRYGVASIQH